MSPEKLLLRHSRKINDAPEALAALRRFVLDLAVRGKLVHQTDSEPPATNLLEQIERAKRSLSRTKLTRTPSIADEEQFFYDLPAGWLWSRLADLSLRIHYGYTASANPTLKTIRLLRITDIQNGRVDWDSVPGCEIRDDDANQYLLQNGDFLIARTGGTVGKSFLVEDVPLKAVFASYLIRIQFPAVLSGSYMRLFFGSSLYWTQLNEGTSGAGQPNVNGRTLGQRESLSLPSRSNSE